MGGLICLHESEPFDGIDPVSRAAPGRGFFQDLPLLAERRVLTPQPLELGALVGRQAIVPAPRIAIRLPHPIPDAVRRRLKLTGQRFGTASAPDEVDDPRSILRRIRSM
jgi:hypothetical protein